jgi:DNA-binding Lrp family transcriptional regulator
MNVDSRLSLNSLDRDILDRLQKDIPLTDDPFGQVAEEFGLPFDKFQLRLNELVANGLISHLGPIYDTKRVGYRTTLLAMECSVDKLEYCARIVGSYPGVSHCYERKNQFNLWSTLAVPPLMSLAQIARKMAFMSSGAIKRTIFLPELKRFKLRVNFHLGEGQSAQVVSSGIRPQKVHTFSPEDIPMLKVLQNGLPCTREPFNTLSLNSRFTADEIFDGMKSHLEKGFIRRVACLVRHRKVGFSSNGMAVWKVSSGDSDRVGAILSKAPSVSHCYERRTHPLWPYTHYAMIHGKSVEEVKKTADSIALNAELLDPLILFSLKEFKKCRLKLYTDEYSKWPEGIV